LIWTFDYLLHVCIVASLPYFTMMRCIAYWAEVHLSTRLADHWFGIHLPLLWGHKIDRITTMSRNSLAHHKINTGVGEVRLDRCFVGN